MKTMGSGHGNNLGFNRILQSSPCLSRESWKKTFVTTNTAKTGFDI